MSATFAYQRRVEFRETDAAGIAHFSFFFGFMEEAEHALYRHVGLSVMTSDEQGTISFPRVSAQCHYAHAAHFEEVLDIQVSIGRLGNKSITYDFDFRHGSREIANGRMTSVCCRIVPGETPQSIVIPAPIRQLLEPFAVP